MWVVSPAPILCRQISSSFVPSILNQPLVLGSTTTSFSSYLTLHFFVVNSSRTSSIFRQSISYELDIIGPRMSIMSSKSHGNLLETFGNILINPRCSLVFIEVALNTPTLTFSFITSICLFNICVIFKLSFHTCMESSHHIFGEVCSKW